MTLFGVHCKLRWSTIYYNTICGLATLTEIWGGGTEYPIKRKHEKGGNHEGLLLSLFFMASKQLS